MSYLKYKTLYIILFIFFTTPAISQDDSTDEISMLKVAIDCRGCNDSYIRQNSLFLNHVRDQALADVYLLVNRSGNASSEIYQLNYKGRGKFEGIDNSFSVDYSRTLTGNEIRDQLLDVIIKGFTPYLMHTTIRDRLVIDVEQSPIDSAGTNSTGDPWKNWVFELQSRFNLRDQDSREELNYSLGFDGDKVSKNWRVRIDGFYERNILKIDESDNNQFTSIRDRKFLGGSVVKSLSNHWSAGVFGNISSNSVNNFEMRFNLSPAVEYSIFDYREVLTKEITFAYRIGYNFQEYLEPTIFDVMQDRFGSQAFSVNIRFRKNWGSIFSSIQASNFLHDFSQNRLTIDNYTSIRIFKGFSVRFNAEFQMIRDQINLQKGDATLEDIITQQRAIATNYQLELGMGLSYTFGSIYNNILNTRL